jgi:hypothetical protein
MPAMGRTDSSPLPVWRRRPGQRETADPGGYAVWLPGFKPHLAIVLPIALAARGEWRTFFATGATALGLMSLSAAGIRAGHLGGFLAVSRWPGRL